MKRGGGQQLPKCPSCCFSLPPPHTQPLVVARVVTRTVSADLLQMHRKDLMVPQWKIDQRITFRFAALVNKMLRQYEKLVAIQFVFYWTFYVVFLWTTNRLLSLL